MSKVIIVSGQEAASNTDILGATLLQTVPSNGVLTFEMQASDNDATNNMVATVQLPDNSTPISGVRVPGTATAGLAGILDDRLNLQTSFNIEQGGRCAFSVVETGDTEFTWRVTFSPRDA